MLCATAVMTVAAVAGGEGVDTGALFGVADAKQVSVSGISSGADMAVQLQVALSETFTAGVGVFAGQAWHCAVYRFPLDKLSHKFDPSTPVCDGCPANTSLTYDHCKQHPAWASPGPLLARAAAAAAVGTIDALDVLRSRRAFLYRGKSDGTYRKGSVNTTAGFFRALAGAGNVYFETSIDSPHLVPGIDPYLCWWEEWGGPDNCTYDGAGHALRWIHGDGALAGGRDNRTEALFPLLRLFDQRPHLPAHRKSYLADEGRVFVPAGCESAGSGCKLHVFLHGCGVTGSDEFSVFSEYGGFNEWAALNKIVVLYPLVNGTDAHTTQLKSGCFDGYGQTGADYDLRTAPQMTAIKSMVDHLTGTVRVKAV